MLLDGFPMGTEGPEVLDFIVSRCKGIQGYVTCVHLRVDAHGRETGIAEVHFGQRAWPALVQCVHKQKFFGYEILVLLSELVTYVAASLPPRGLRALAISLGVLPPSVDADLVPAHRTVSAEEHCALRDDVAGSTIVQHRLIQQPDWWPYNNPRIMLQMPAIPQLRRPEPDGWDSWDEMRADVIVRSKPIEMRTLRCTAIAQPEFDTANSTGQRT